MIDESHAGRSYPATEPYQVTAVKIAEFAAAIGDDNPAYAGASPIAPPTFAAVIAGRAWEALWADEGLICVGPEAALGSCLLFHAASVTDPWRELQQRARR